MTQEKKHHNSLVVRVLAFDKEDEKPIRDIVKNLYYDKNRDWLSKFVIWGVSNGVTIQIINMKDEENEKSFA